MPTFGNASAGINEYDWTIDEITMCGRYPIREAGAVSQLTFALVNQATSHQACHAKGLIYDDDGAGGAPGTLMGLSQPVDIADNADWGMYACVFDGVVNLTAGNWWLCLISDASATGLETMYSAITGGTFAALYDTYADGPSNPASSPAYTDTSKLYVIATYTRNPSRSILTVPPHGPHAFKRRASTPPRKRFKVNV